MIERQRILGIDPGSRLTGFGIVDSTASGARYVASGSVNSSDGTFPERLRTIHHSITEIVRRYCPDAVVIESVFMHKNASSALKLGQARSAAICATFIRDVEFHEYAPREIKQSVVGTGGATKAQVAHMVCRLLSLEGSPSADAADALAAALCHANRRRLVAAMGGARLAAGLK